MKYIDGGELNFKEKNSRSTMDGMFIHSFLGEFFFKNFFVPVFCVLMCLSWVQEHEYSAYKCQTKASDFLA